VAVPEKASDHHLSNVTPGMGSPLCWRPYTRRIASTSRGSRGRGSNNIVPTCSEKGTLVTFPGAHIFAWWADLFLRFVRW
jgi:hypothetical protein